MSTVRNHKSLVDKVSEELPRTQQLQAYPERTAVFVDENPPLTSSEREELAEKLSQVDELDARVSDDVIKVVGKSP